LETDRDTNSASFEILMAQTNAPIVAEQHTPDLIESLQYAVRNGYEMTRETALTAAAQGHTDVLEWLYHHYREVYDHDPAYCEKAARGGHLRTLQWLRQMAFPWDGNTLKQACMYGKKSGDWSVLCWSIDSGCPN
jgi:hypothetical protein